MHLFKSDILCPYMASPDLSFGPDLSSGRVLIDPTALPRAVWQVDKRGALPYIGLELGLAGISLLAGLRTEEPLTGIGIYAFCRLFLAVSTLPISTVKM